MTDVVMPQMGESIVEGTLTKWLKKPGDTVERDEPLFEISTDKVDTEIPSPAAGVIAEVLVQEGQTVAVNAVVARINEGGGAAAAPAQPAAEAPAPAAPAAPPAPTAAPAPAAPAPEPAGAGPYPFSPGPAPESKTEEPKEPAGPLSPLVRRIARENNVDLSKVTGTGAGGRITKEDVEAFVRQSQAPAAPVAPAAPAPVAAAPIAPPPAPAVPAAPIGQAQPTAKTRVEAMSIMRQRIAEHMVMSKRTSAHVTTVHRVDMTRVAKMRTKHKDDFAQRYGMSLTFLPFVARATVEALRTYPILNASIDGTNIIYHNDINVGIAVALDGGLIVPVIRNADEKNVLGLQRSIVDLASRARAKQLKPDEIQGGTFSITNFGSFGSVFATPVINQPQVAILGVGTVEKVPVVVDDAIAIRSQCYLALTFDHRLIDGALGDQFTAKVKSVLENWSEEVL
ncbi:MAG TPA: 2-oxoglutarate dehydrogenase, E2 component, dihydrolipoamide succinyltransferase [Bryobacteraceae bacterium]|nr:2-oxoglutarate dehydrogenase, E2 component, dihydrolipoamide succinyltransferase [Bryobacteraceae bacterium]